VRERAGKDYLSAHLPPTVPLVLLHLASHSSVRADHRDHHLHHWLHQALNLSNNGIYGAVPAGLASVPGLKLLDLSGNLFNVSECASVQEQTSTCIGS
jgi:hypothetical protein